MPRNPSVPLRYLGESAANSRSPFPSPARSGGSASGGGRLTLPATPALPLHSPPALPRARAVRVRPGTWGTPHPASQRRAPPRSQPEAPPSANRFGVGAIAGRPAATYLERRRSSAALSRLQPPLARAETPDKMTPGWPAARLNLPPSAPVACQPMTAQRSESSANHSGSGRGAARLRRK